MVYDMTCLEGNFKSLIEYLELEENEITNFILDRNDSEIEVENFLNYFGKPEFKLFEKDIDLVSLHLTTNKDSCYSIMKLGIIDLQRVVTLETPFKGYLNKHKISFDLIQETITYNGTNFSLKDKQFKKIRYRIFEDYQINGFLYTENALKYNQGIVKEVPEILTFLSDCFSNNSIKDDWRNDPAQRTYVIKFSAPLSHYHWDSFNYSYDTNIAKEIHKRKFIINESLVFIHDRLNCRKYVNGSYINPCSRDHLYSFLKPNVQVPRSSILNIYSEEDYRVNLQLN